MGGTKHGAKKTVKKILETDPDHYSKAGRKGNKGGKFATNGFDNDPDRAKIAGAKGGAKSKRSAGRKLPRKVQDGVRENRGGGSLR
jgi:general stress protein YciG